MWIHRRRMGFTFLELVLSMVILAALSAALIPTTKVIVKRQKEKELRRVLLEVRESIDRFKKAHEQGEITLRDERQMGYPADFEEMIVGVSSSQDASVNVRFLRRIPVDPMTGKAEWGMRSVQDDPEDTSWGRENLFDIYSLSDGTALDGTAYSNW